MLLVVYMLIFLMLLISLVCKTICSLRKTLLWSFPLLFGSVSTMILQAFLPSLMMNQTTKKLFLLGFWKSPLLKKARKLRLPSQSRPPQTRKGSVWGGVFTAVS